MQFTFRNRTKSIFIVINDKLYTLYVLNYNHDIMMFNIFLPEIVAPNSTELSVVGSTHVEVHERPTGNKNME